MLQVFYLTMDVHSQWGGFYTTMPGYRDTQVGLHGGTAMMYKEQMWLQIEGAAGSQRYSGRDTEAQ
jgi:hypothetical protein